MNTNYSIIFVILILILYWIYLYKKLSIEYFSTIKLPNDIWLYWETKKGEKKPVYLDICYETIIKNCGKNCKVHLLNEKNI